MSESNDTHTAQTAEREERDRRISTGEWFLLMLFLSVPLLNILVVIVGALAWHGNATLRNYFRAALIWIGIGGLAIGIMLLARM